MAAFQKKVNLYTPLSLGDLFSQGDLSKVPTQCDANDLTSDLPDCKSTFAYYYDDDNTGLWHIIFFVWHLKMGYQLF